MCQTVDKLPAEPVSIHKKKSFQVSRDQIRNLIPETWCELPFFPGSDSSNKWINHSIEVVVPHNLTEVEWLKLPSLPENSLVWRLARLHINKKETSPSPPWSWYFLFNIFLHCIHSPLNALISLGNKISHLRLFTGTVVHDKLLLYPCWWIFQKAH